MHRKGWSIIFAWGAYSAPCRFYTRLRPLKRCADSSLESFVLEKVGTRKRGYDGVARKVGIRRLVLLSLGCAWLFAGIARGQDTPGAMSAPDEVHRRLAASGLTTSDIASTFAFVLDPRNVRLISLPEVVRETLSNNLSIRVARMDRGIAEDEINEIGRASCRERV